MSYTNVAFTRALHTYWKDGRAAECGGLENRFTGTPGNEGSNPSPSARKSFVTSCVRGHFLCLLKMIIATTTRSGRGNINSS